MKGFNIFAGAAAMIAAAAGASTATAEQATAAVPPTPYQYLPDVPSLPAGVVQVSPVIPAMGEHWANPKDLPLGPIYCVHEGKVICLEFMISQEDFAAGKSWPELAGTPGLPPIAYTSISFEPNGHEGYEIPHYDIHMFFVPREVVNAIK